MRGQWTATALTLLTLGHLALCKPEQCPSLTNVCFYNDTAKLSPASSTGQYFAVGGLFDIRTRGQNAYSCGTNFNPAGILHTQAFLWSLNYWQSGSSSVSIGAVVFDSCERTGQMVHNILGFEQCNLRVPGISPHNVVAFVGPTSNMDTNAAAKLTGDMRLTLISPSADSGMLSSAKNYPYFLRTTPTVQMDVEIMAYMLTHVDTKFVAVIYQESEMGSFESFRTKMAEKGICISGSYFMTGTESPDVLRTFVASTLANLAPTRFVALFLSLDFMDRFLEQVTNNGQVRAKNIVYLMTSQIRRSSKIFNGRHAVAVSDAIVLERAEPPGAEVERAVKEFKEYWNQTTILTSMGQRPRISDPFLVNYLRDGNKLPAFDLEAAYVIMATKAIVDGVRQAGQSACRQNDYLCSQFFDSDSRGSTIYKNIRSASNLFTDAGAGGDFANGDLKRDFIRYNVYRYLLNSSFVQIADYQGDAVPTVSQPIRDTPPYRPGQCHDNPCPQCPDTSPSTTPPLTTPLSPVTTPRRCGPVYKGNLSRVYYPPDHEITGAYMLGQRSDLSFATRFEIGQRWIIALGVLAGLGILSVMVFEVYILYKLLGTRMGNKWRTMWLGQLLLFAVLLCYLTLFAYLFIPTKETCGLTRFGVGVSYSMCFAVLLVKLMVILTSKASDNALLAGEGDSPNYLRGIYQFLMFVFVVGVQVVIDAQWLITVPPEAVKVTSNNGEAVWVCNHYTFKASDSMTAMTDMSSFVRSEFENHVLSLVYIMFLILITTVLALSAHGIITNHRESVFIGIAAGFSIPIWLAWSLVGGLNKDNAYAHEFGDACIAFGLFVTATLILFAMFLPKVRQLVNMGVEGIYFEDDHDTVYGGGSVIMAPSHKSHPNSVIYVNSQGQYSQPYVVNNGEGLNYIRQSSYDKPTPASTYSAPPTYLKKGSDLKGGSVLQVTDDLSGRRPLEKKRATSEVAYGTGSRPRSYRGMLPRSRSQTSIGAL
ncbi:hypothetical protein ACOMHN_038973 [Nucella lapillus]